MTALAVKRFHRNPVQLFLLLCSIECMPQNTSLLSEDQRAGVCVCVCGVGWCVCVYALPVCSPYVTNQNPPHVLYLDAAFSGISFPFIQRRAGPGVLVQLGSASVFQ